MRGRYRVEQTEGQDERKIQGGGREIKQRK